VRLRFVPHFLRPAPLRLRDETAPAHPPEHNRAAHPFRHLEPSKGTNLLHHKPTPDADKIRVLLTHFPREAFGEANSASSVLQYPQQPRHLSLGLFTTGPAGHVRTSFTVSLAIAEKWRMGSADVAIIKPPSSLRIPNLVILPDLSISRKNAYAARLIVSNRQFAKHASSRSTAFALHSSPHHKILCDVALCSSLPDFTKPFSHFPTIEAARGGGVLRDFRRPLYYRRFLRLRLAIAPPKNR